MIINYLDEDVFSWMKSYSYDESLISKKEKKRMGTGMAYNNEMKTIVQFIDY
jgi:hypothetical protein